MVTTHVSRNAVLAALSIAFSATNVLAQATIEPPTATGAFDYQIGGRYAADADVTVISSDSGIDVTTGVAVSDGEPLDTTRYNICYLNVFQTQPEEAAYWKLPANKDLILTAGGEPVHDPDREWRGEMLFDVSTAEKRDALLARQTGWIAECKRQGFKAIEPDNIDAYTHSANKLTVDDAQAYITAFVADAHRQGLAVAQKNATRWVNTRGPDGQFRAQSVGFDFAISEECQLTGECKDMIDFYKPARVFEIEYWYDSADSSSGVTVPARSRTHFDQACAARGSTIRVVLRNRDVRPKGEPGYVGQSCNGRPQTNPTQPPAPGPGDDDPGPDDEPDDVAGRSQQQS